jgi:hypothetical protein
MCPKNDKASKSGKATESRGNKAERFNEHIAVSNLIVQPSEIKSFTALTFSSVDTSNTIPVIENLDNYRNQFTWC